MGAGAVKRVQLSRLFSFRCRTVDRRHWTEKVLMAVGMAENER